MRRQTKENIACAVAVVERIIEQLPPLTFNGVEGSWRAWDRRDRVLRKLIAKTEGARHQKDGENHTFRLAGTSARSCVSAEQVLQNWLKKARRRLEEAEAA